jgi:Fe-S-cluster-containing dehydrogenase component
MQYSDEKDVAIKCNLCIDRLAEGKGTACMSVCPTECIGLGGKRSIAAVFEKTA